MRKISLILGLMLFSVQDSVFAAEGYRYMHVTIDTPWTIFLFLLVIVLFPFLLMAILYWYFAFKSIKENKEMAELEEAEPGTAKTSAPANNAE